MAGSMKHIMATLHTALDAIRASGSARDIADMTGTLLTLAAGVYRYISADQRAAFIAQCEAAWRRADEDAVKHEAAVRAKVVS